MNSDWGASGETSEGFNGKNPERNEDINTAPLCNNSVSTEDEMKLLLTRNDLWRMSGNMVLLVSRAISVHSSFQTVRLPFVLIINRIISRQLRDLEFFWFMLNFKSYIYSNLRLIAAGYFWNKGLMQNIASLIERGLDVWFLAVLS